MFYGRGAGGAPTASAVLGDLVAVARNRLTGGRGAGESAYADLRVRPMGETVTRYHIRLDVEDRPGVLADIATRVAAAGGNVIEVLHQRLFAAPSVQSAELELMVEVRDAPQGVALVEALEAGGYAVRRG